MAKSELWHYCIKATIYPFNYFINYFFFYLQAASHFPAKMSRKMSEFSSKYWIPSEDIDFLGLKGVMEDEPKSVSRTRMKITFRQLKQMLPENNLDNPVKILQATKRYMNHLQNCPPVNYNKCECFQKYLEESEEKSKELSEQWTKRFFFFFEGLYF